MTMSRLGDVIVTLVSASALLAPWLMPFDPAAQELAHGSKARRALTSSALTSSAATSCRACCSARVSRCSSASSSSASRPRSARSLGAIAGYVGGVLDTVISRVMDVLLAFPGMLLAIALVAVLGPSLTNVVLALIVIGWVGYARLVRGQVLRAREFEYVGRGTGARARARRASLLRHVLPTALPAVTVQATLGMAGAILSEAALSFLGLGVQPPTPSWGTMINGGRAHLLDAPHLTIFPGIALAIVVLGFNFLGDGLRDSLDPSSPAGPGSDHDPCAMSMPLGSDRIVAQRSDLTPVTAGQGRRRWRFSSGRCCGSRANPSVTVRRASSVRPSSSCGLGKPREKADGRPCLVDGATQPVDGGVGIVQPHREVGDLRGHVGQGLLVADQGGVPHQRIARLLETPQSLRGGRPDSDTPPAARAAGRPPGAAYRSAVPDVAGQKPCAPKEHRASSPAVIRVRGRHRQRLERLHERRAIASCLCRVEPDFAQRRIDAQASSGNRSTARLSVSNGRIVAAARACARPSATPPLRPRGSSAASASSCSRRAPVVAARA